MFFFVWPLLDNGQVVRMKQTYVPQCSGLDYSARAQRENVCRLGPIPFVPTVLPQITHVFDVLNTPLPFPECDVFASA